MTRPTGRAANVSRLSQSARASRLPSARRSTAHTGSRSFLTTTSFPTRREPLWPPRRSCSSGFVPLPRRRLRSPSIRSGTRPRRCGPCLASGFRSTTHGCGSEKRSPPCVRRTSIRVSRFVRPFISPCRYCSPQHALRTSIRRARRHRHLSQPVCTARAAATGSRLERQRCLPGWR